MKKSLFACLALQALLATSVLAAPQTPESVFNGYTTLKFYDYENLYDPSGNIITSGAAAAGDTLQGVFVVTSVTPSGPAQGYNFSTTPPAGSVELTGVFDEYITAFTPTGAGAGYATLAPDTTSVLGQKAITGAQFQTTYGSNSMIGFYYNNVNAMPDQTSNGLNAAPYNSVSGAWALATTGSKWLTFGATSGSVGTNWYWAANQTAPGSATFGASLQLIQNLSGFANGQFGLIPEAQPQNAPASWGLIPGALADGGTTYIAAPTGLGANLNGTAFNLFSSDPAALDILPEPTGFLVVGGLFGLWAVGMAARRRLRRA